MAKSQGQVQKIYQLKTLGFDTVDSQLKVIKKDFDEIKKAKRSAEGKLLNTSDVAEIKKFSEEIARLKVKEAELRVERQKMMNEQKAANIARQEELRLQREKIKGNQAESGSIVTIRNQIKELNAALILKNQKGTSLVSFQGQNLSIDQAVAKLKELTAAEQEFRRQFAKDQTLVGEYTTGIVNAFKQLGLDDLVAGQVTRSQQRLNTLNSEFDKLQKELQETRAAGAATDTIEKQMIENRNEVIKLDTEVARLKKDLRGTGDIGNQISTSISNGFKSLRGQVTSFALQYVGFTALFNKITSEISEGISEASKLEGVTAAFNNLNKPGLLDNLRDATRGTVSDLELMQRAVQASNFQIPLETLGSLLDFARRRAKDTGQEVNFLVDSIVTGIGRKSPLILDNLGISAVRLRQNLKGLSDESATVGDVAAAVSKIIAEENLKAGKEIDTTTERIARNRAQWQTLRAEFTKNLLPALAALGTFVLFLITNLPTLVTIVGLLAAGWAVSNAQLLLLRANLILYNIQLAASYAALGVLSVAQLAYNSILFVFNGIITVATAGLRLFGITAATAAGPLRIILTIAGLLGAAFLGMSKAMGNVAAAINDNIRRLNALNAVTRETNKIADVNIGKLNAQVAIIKSSATSIDTKREALQKLIGQNAAFQNVLKDQQTGLQKSIEAFKGTREEIELLDDAYKQVTKSILLQARAQASASLTAEKQASVDEIAILRRRIESEFATGGKKLSTSITLSKSERELLTGGLFGEGLLDAASTSIRNTGKGISFLAKDFDKVIEALKKEEDKRIQNLQDFQDLQKQSDKELNEFLKAGTTDAAVFEVDIKVLKDKIELLTKEIDSFQGTRADLQKKIAERNRLQKQLDKLLGKDEKDKPDRGSRLTGAQKDAFKDIDALRDKEIADAKIKFQERKITEEEFLLEILRINRDAINDKLKLLKGANAEERKQIADLSLEKITNEQETNNKIFELRKQALENQLDDQIKNIQERDRRIQEDPSFTSNEKAQSKLDADNAILALQIRFNAAIDALEKQLNQHSLTNAKEGADAVRKTKEQIIQDELNAAEARLKDIDDQGDRDIATINFRYERLRQTILKNDKLTVTQRARALEKLAKINKVTILSAELEKLTKEFAEIKKQYEAGLKTTKEFLEKKAELEKKKTDLDEANTTLSDTNIALPSGANTQQTFAERLAKEFGFEEGSAEEQLLGETISQTFALATDAMNSFFDAERQRINESLELNLARLDQEKQQVLARAQSQAEIASIEKQYAAKKRKAEIEAGEQLKKSRRAEAKLALATELANIAVSAAANPANAFTFGAAGVIMYGILAGLALGRYALRTSEINSQKFAFGGKPGEVPTRGGEFGGKPHSKGGTDFTFKDKNYNAEVEELAVIRTKDAPTHKKYTVTGNQMQLASFANKIGGGIDFKPGARITKLASGGFLGQSLEAPVFTPSSNTLINNAGGVTEEKMNELLEKIEEMNEATDRRFDRLKVEQVTSTVTNAQKKQVKQSEIGTL